MLTEKKVFNVKRPFKFTEKLLKREIKCLIVRNMKMFNNKNVNGIKNGEDCTA